MNVFIDEAFENVIIRLDMYGAQVVKEIMQHAAGVFQAYSKAPNSFYDGLIDLSVHLEFYIEAVIRGDRKDMFEICLPLFDFLYLIKQLRRLSSDMSSVTLQGALRYLEGQTIDQLERFAEIAPDVSEHYEMLSYPMHPFNEKEESTIFRGASDRYKKASFTVRERVVSLMPSLLNTHPSQQRVFRAEVSAELQGKELLEKALAHD